MDKINLDNLYLALFGVLVLVVMYMIDYLVNKHITRKIDKDWEDFEKFTTATDLRGEYERCLELAQKNPKNDRFRRLCQFISVRWAADLLPK